MKPSETKIGEMTFRQRLKHLFGDHEGQLIHIKNGVYQCRLCGATVKTLHDPMDHVR